MKFVYFITSKRNPLEYWEEEIIELNFLLLLIKNADDWLSGGGGDGVALDFLSLFFFLRVYLSRYLSILLILKAENIIILALLNIDILYNDAINNNKYYLLDLENFDRNNCVFRNFF